MRSRPAGASQTSRILEYMVLAAVLIVLVYVFPFNSIPSMSSLGSPLGHTEPLVVPVISEVVGPDAKDKQLDELRAKLESIGSDRDKLQTEVNKLKEQLAAVPGDREKLQTEVNKLKEQLAAVPAEGQSAKKEEVANVVPLAVANAAAGTGEEFVKHLNALLLKGAKHMIGEPNADATCDQVLEASTGIRVGNRAACVPNDQMEHLVYPCNNPKCSHELDCLENEVEHISADGIVMRKGQPAPCCADLMDLMTVEIQAILLKWNVTGYPILGTLLGAIRRGSSLPWTFDVDFAVASQHQIFLPEVLADFHAHGYHVGMSGIVRVCFHLELKPGLRRFHTEAVEHIDKVGVYADLWQMSITPPDKGLYVQTLQHGCIFPFKYVFPFTIIENYGVFKSPLMVPHNSTAYLFSTFGPDCLTRIVKSGHGSLTCGTNPGEQRGKPYTGWMVPQRVFQSVHPHKWWDCLTQGTDADQTFDWMNKTFGHGPPPYGTRVFPAPGHVLHTQLTLTPIVGRQDKAFTCFVTEPGV